MKTLMFQEEKKKKGKIRLVAYPYTYVRTTVMRSLLLKKEDYDKIMKMSLSEIANLLQESDYKDEINELAAKYSGAELVERALSKNLARRFKKLKRISPYELNLLISAYLNREDIFNIKTILRGKYTNTDDSETESLLIPVGTLSKRYLAELLKKKTIEEILKNIQIIDFRHIAKAYDSFKKNNMLIEIENALDRHYYNETLNFVSRIPKQGALFKEFLEAEIEVLNILTILRLKKENLSKDEIEKYIFVKNKTAFFGELLKSRSIEEILSALEKSKYGRIIRDAIKKFNESRSLIPIEMSLYRYLLGKSMLLQHQHPLSVDIILGYMFAKEIEARNLRVIAKGKQLSLPNEFIESQLVV